MIRVLQVLGCMDRGGAENMIMNLYRSIDRSKVQFDFVVHTQRKCDFDEEIEALGGCIYHIPAFKGYNLIQYINCWHKLLKSHPEWKIVHGHIRSVASIYLPIAKHFNRTTIIHSHSISEGGGVVGKIKRCMEYPLRHQADYFFACSQKAGEWLFGSKVCSNDNYYVINNAIDVSAFAYNEQIRENLRSELKLDGKLVVGHIGRFEAPKNHPFIVEIMSELVKLNQNVKLVLVGDGSKRTEIEALIRDKGLDDYVLFLGLRSDTNNIYQIFDAFLFPSIYEGLSVVLVEAQSSGVPIVASENAVADEIRITSLINALNLDASPEIWAKQILKSAAEPHSKDTAQKIIDAGFDIKSNSEWLENFYLSI